MLSRADTLTRSTSSRRYIRRVRCFLSSTVDAFKNRVHAVRSVFNHSPTSVDIARTVGSASIRELFLSGSPSTVLFVVRSVVVDSLYRKTVRRISHIFPECSNVVTPFFAHLYSTAAVMLKGLTSRVCAALYNPLPYSINSFVIESVSFVNVLVVASFALCRISTSKMTSAYQMLSSAKFASTPPSDSSPFVARSFSKNCPFSKFHSSEINIFNHKKVTSVLDKFNYSMVLSA